MIPLSTGWRYAEKGRRSMKVLSLRLPVIAVCALAGACGSSTGPTSAGYAGQWSGTTAHGRSITFTISPDEAVTTITVDHDFNGCSGSQTFSNLSISIAPNVTCIPGPCGPSVGSYRAFGFASGNRIEGPSTDLSGLFPSTNRAEGLVNFRNYPGCGSATGVAWTATRR
jgi:hypothetical protein